MALAFTYEEAVDDQSPPTSYGFTQEGARAVATYYVTPNCGLGSSSSSSSSSSASTNPCCVCDLNDIVIEILGFNRIDPYPGSLAASPSGPNAGQRIISPPLQHPTFSQLYATAVTDFRGIGAPARKVPCINPTNTQYIFPFWSFYPKYKITVDFTSRLYNILTDDTVAMISNSWFSENRPAEEYDFVYANEMNRYISFEFMPKFDSATANRGQMVYNTDNPCIGHPDLPMTPVTKPKTTFPGLIEFYQPNQMLRVTWWSVPWRYITSDNSYIVPGKGKFTVDAGHPARQPWIGRVNQNQIAINGTIFPKGSLLYLGYNAHPYQPPNPDFVSCADDGTAGQKSTCVPKQSVGGPTWDCSNWPSPGVYDPTCQFGFSKLCNITLDFLLTYRNPAYNPSTNAPEDLGLLPLANPNYVVAGHNLIPWYMDKQFHFCQTVPGTDNNCENFKPSPKFLSFPMEILFTDPDVPQADPF